MSRNTKRSSILFILFCCNIGCNSIFAQGFDYMVSLPEVKAKGFHKIIISPEISAKSAVDFSDLRLFDNQKKEVPYILRKDFIRKQHKTFVPYQLLSKSTPGDTATEIIVKNQFNTRINNLSVFLNNAEVSKQIIISGSYNQKQWYAVKQNYNISGIANENNVTELNTIFFPLSDYTFYKILINDKNSLPVKVLHAGYYQDSISYGEETLLPKPQVTRTEDNTNHHTLIQLNFNEVYSIDKINLKISAPTLYRRAISIYALRNINQTTEKIFLQQSTLNSSTSNQIVLDNVHEKQLLFEIENDNNPILQINEIDCFQLSQYVIAYFEKRGNYNLKFGNKKLTYPIYDLNYFENVIPTRIPQIETSKLNIIKNPEKPVKISVEPFFYNKKFFLWTAIIVVTLILMLVSGKMLNEMNKKKE